MKVKMIKKEGGAEEKLRLLKREVKISCLRINVSMGTLLVLTWGANIKYHLKDTWGSAMVTFMC